MQQKPNAFGIPLLNIRRFLMEQITQAQASESIEITRQAKPVRQLDSKPIDNRILAEKLPIPIQVVQTAEEEQELYELWVDAYKDVYPKYTVCQNDPQNAQAHILYARDENGKVTSSVRLTIDSPLGMPSDEYHPPEVAMYRDYGNKLMEFGRLVSKKGSIELLKTYYKSIYQIAVAENVDVIIMGLKQKDVAFHRNLIGAYALLDDMKMPVGGEYKMSCVAWEIHNTKSRFFRWTGLNEEVVGDQS